MKLGNFHITLWIIVTNEMKCTCEKWLNKIQMEEKTIFEYFPLFLRTVE